MWLSLFFIYFDFFYKEKNRGIQCARVHCTPPDLGHELRRKDLVRWIGFETDRRAA